MILNSLSPLKLDGDCLFRIVNTSAAEQNTARKTLLRLNQGLTKDLQGTEGRGKALRAFMGSKVIGDQCPGR